MPVEPGLHLPRGRRQVGQGMVEYALILVMISMVVIVILLTMGKQMTNLFSDITSTVTGF